MNPSRHFRIALRDALPTWQQEGLVTESAARTLAERYQLAELKGHESRLLAGVLYSLAALLIGGGVLSFVAANWDDMPCMVKVALLLFTLMGFQGGAFVCLYHANMQRLGRALAFGGSLVLGANIGLMAQTFNISGQWYGLFGGWALGVLPMAYLLRSTSIGLLALVTGVTWAAGFAEDMRGIWEFVLPPLILVVYGSLAYLTRSRLLYLGTLGAVIVGSLAASVDNSNSGKTVWLVGSIFAFVLWCVGRSQFARRQTFAKTSLGIAGLALIAMAYVGGFHEVMQDVGNEPIRLGLWMVSPLWVTVVGVLAIVINAQQPKTEHLDPWMTRLAGISTGIVLLSVPIASMASGVYAVVLLHGALIAAAGIAVRSGIVYQRQRDFWIGCVVILGTVVSRFLEFETGLLMKSAAFVVCGLAVTAIGRLYERATLEKDGVKS